MKLIKRTKKGFTIVELVIVIAVIAVLAAVLIPTFINLTNKANKAADESLVTSLNKALAIEEVDHDVDNMHDAVECLKREGYLASALVTKSDQKLLYSLKENRFLLEEDKNEGVYQGTPDYKFWTIQDSYDVTKQQYSIYAADNFNVAAVSGLKVGFDAGDCKNITSIAYVGVGETQNVVIRTNTVDTNLSIDAQYDTVSHFDAVGKVTIDHIDMNCYNEFGKAAYVKLSDGKVIAKKSAEIKVLFATNADASKVAVIKEKGTIEAAYTTAEAISTANAARDGGIPLTYTVDDQPVTESLVNGYADAAVEENKIEEIEKSGLYDARIGTNAFANFDEAVAAATDSDTIVLCRDIVFGEDRSVPVWIKRGFDIDLNNHTFETQSTLNWNASNNAYTASAICYSSGDSKTANISNGNIKTKYGAGVYADDPGMTVTLSNLNIYQDHSHYIQTTECYSSAVRLTFNATAIINSGRYEAQVAIDMESSGSGKTGHCTVNGGTFIGKLHCFLGDTPLDLVINGGTFSNTGLTLEQFNNFVASGKTVTTNPDGSWTVAD